MYAITGIVGRVGGALVRSLLADNLPVRGGHLPRAGTRNPQPRVRMIDGFNESCIDFADQGRVGQKRAGLTAPTNFIGSWPPAMSNWKT